MKYLGLGMIRLYQKTLSPLLPPSCRFEPTCSRYAYTAIDRYGLLRGGWMAIQRLGRCHPFYHGNPYDPVPERAASGGPAAREAHSK
jgi:putative membrane protein insertion efficiency factor